MPVDCRYHEDTDIEDDTEPSEGETFWYTIYSCATLLLCLFGSYTCSRQDYLRSIFYSSAAVKKFIVQCFY